MKSPEELTEMFRAQGLKVTPQRQAIFRVLHASLVHPTAEAVHAEVAREMPTVSLRTVYQTLNDLAAMGELVALDLGTGSSRFDPNLGAHQHLVCDRCGKVTDLDLDFGDVAVPSGKEHGYTISTTQIVFRGRCETCVADRSSSSRPGSRPLTTDIPTSPTQEALKRYG